MCPRRPGLPNFAPSHSHDRPTWRPRVLAVALACSTSGVATAVIASDPPATMPPATLKVDSTLTVTVPRLDRRAARFLSAEALDGATGGTITARGNATLRQLGLSVRADTVVYNQETDVVDAKGNVTLNRDGDVAIAPSLVYDFNTEKGEMQAPVYQLAQKLRRRHAAQGSASVALFSAADERDKYYDATYSTCVPGNEDWVLKVKELDLDHSREVGEARTATVYFKGVPILYAPFLTFPLNDDRKSGFLAPTLISSNRSGFQFWLPYYWNIAENRDATITPKILTRRGLLMAGEYRYLDPRFNGQLDAEYLPSDAIANRDRSLFSVKHVHDLGQFFMPGWTLALNAQRVSDDNYFRDLTTRLQLTSQTNLPRDVFLGWQNDTWAITARLLSYQTLQDPAAPIETPYRTLPAINVVGDRVMEPGWRWRVESELADFRHPTLVNGQRWVVHPQISWPLRAPWGFVTPKAAYHLTHYSLDQNLVQPGLDFRDQKTARRSLPILSVDSGLYFDRPVQAFGQAFTQTLEPRAYYVHIPYREQTRLPNFSSAVTDFNFAQLFTENQFIGSDRINDANQITLAATSRFIDRTSGEERLTATVGQRFYFESPKVGLSETPADTRRTDLLAAIVGRPWTDWTIESSLQYNTVNQRLERSLIAAKYQPQPGKVFNAGYRYTRGELRQIDLSTQWPINAEWTALARWNYSFRESKLIEGLAGFEYNGGCWQVRALLHRFITASQQVSTSFQIQLELSGLSRIGINPLDTLRQNISGYKRSDEINP
jgi:LPS-assembly protein